MEDLEKDVMSVEEEEDGGMVQKLYSRVPGSLYVIPG